jgi:V/A-type H+-transporting ATPase subunit I
MLTDLAYGALLLGVGIYIRKKIGDKNVGSKKFTELLIYCSIATLIAGFVFRSCLADFFDLMGIKLPNSINKYTINILEGKTSFYALICAIGVGLVHLFIGICIGIVNNLRARNYDLLLENAAYLLLELSIVLYALYKVNFPVTPILPKAFLIIAVCCIFYKKKFMGVFNIMGFIGSTCSYARLVALCLATTAIGMVINILFIKILGAFISKNVKFIVLRYMLYLVLLIPFIIFHVLNAAINILGAFVHSVRLHYVEFFGIFYEGGGRLYTPFKAKRDYLEVLTR